MELVIDKITDAFYEEATTNRRLVRKAQVHGITPGTPSGYMVRALEMAGLPRLRDRHPEIADLLCHQRIVRPLSAGDAAEIDLVYQPNEVTATAPNTLVIRTNTSLASEIAESMLLPGGKGKPATITPFMFGLKIGEGEFKVGGVANRLVPMRQIDVDCFSTTEPPENMADAVGCVNDRAWCGKPAGYWLATRVQEVYTSDLPNVHAFSLSFLTRSYRNWAEWDFVRDQWRRVLATDEAKQQAFKLCTTNYEYGVNNRIPGVVVMGQYYPENFADLFGFDNTRARRISLPSRDLFKFGYSYATLPSAR